MSGPFLLAASLVSCLGGPRPIEETFPGCAPEESRPVRPTADLERVAAPGDARCNDGSEPVMLVRAATDPRSAGDWVVFLQGGNSCHDAETCRERYCRTGPALMGSSRVPARERGEGVATALPENPFAGWNVAVLHYCSSDQWLGDAPAPVALGSSWWSTALPPLADASHLLFAGSSAGGSGVTFHLDEVTERHPGTRVVGFVDGMMEPDLSAMTPEHQRMAERRQRAWWDLRFHRAWNAFHADACERSGGSCDDPLFLWGTWVKSPAVLRFDLRDPVLSELYTLGEGIPTAQIVRGYASAGKKMALADRSDRAVVVTDCALHYAAAEDDGTLRTAVRDADGEPVRAVDAAWRLLMEGRPTAAVDLPGGGGSICPPKRRDP